MDFLKRTGRLPAMMLETISKPGCGRIRHCITSDFLSQQRVLKLVVVALLMLSSMSPTLDIATAQDAPPASPAAGDAGLVTKQDAISLRFKRFEKTLLQMVEYMRKTDPGRAELLVRAIGRSKEKRVAQQLDQIVRLLQREQFGDAIDHQDAVVNVLRSLLDLLQSEDRLSELESEKKRIKDILKDLGKLIISEKDLRAATERGGDPSKLTPQQQKIAGKTDKLGDKIDQQDKARQRADDSDADEADSDQSKPSDGKPSDGKPSDGKPSDGKPSDGKPSDGKPSDGKPSDGQSAEQQKTPGREEIEKAHKEMERAIQELKQQDHDAASGHQDEAIAKLREAKDKLEEILRQLREEERELLLAALEARFQKMLALQLVVYSGTVNLDKTKKDDWTTRHFGRSRDLAIQEELIALEASKALTLLQDEGSSVAFPEAVKQLRDDMLSVARLLERTEVGELTLGLERDIIEALEELVEALQRELEAKKDEQSQGQNQQQQPQDRALVDQLAELKMLRTLQLRVNRRTTRMGRLINGEQATEAEVVEQLQELARRQGRIQEATFNLSVEKNR